MDSGGRLMPRLNAAATAVPWTMRELVASWLPAL